VQEALEVLAGRWWASSAVAATVLIYAANGEFEACGAVSLPRGYIDAMVTDHDRGRPQQPNTPFNAQRR
jgi:hypothetical protein